MKKKLLALTLALALSCSLILPTSAAQSADDRLAAVTAIVKQTLNLDTEGYQEFYGDLSEDLPAPSWYLEWTGAGESLSITATEEGKVLSYHRYETADNRVSNQFAPSFPSGSQTEAQAAAQQFLDLVLTDDETATLEENTVRLGATTYRFHGDILLNGLSAGLSYSISVRCEDNAVVSFYRDDLNGIVMGGVPSSAANTTVEQARTALRGTLALRLEYALPQDGGKQSVLRYLPEYGHDYYVDAATGELIDLTELSLGIDEGGMAAGASPSASTESAADSNASYKETLTQAELQGADQLKNVLSKEALDAKARAISALGLKAYTLSGVDYAVARESDPSGSNPVTATLYYGRQVAGNAWRRTVTLDAKTGALIQVYSSAWLPDESLPRTVSAGAAQRAAESFLQEQCGAQFTATELYRSTDALASERQISHSFTFCQNVNGYFFPDNRIQVGVDATDGSISSYDAEWDDGVTFDSADGLLTNDQALDAWLNTYTVQLQYVMVPTAIDYSRPEYRPLMDYGISYLYQLKLGYQLEREDYLLGIDAKTGQPIQPAWSQASGGITYSDLSGHWAQSYIERLAQYNVGYTGGMFLPEKALTQLDLVALLASAEGYLYYGESEGAADALYEYAYGLGLLDRKARDDAHVLTRVETVRFLLDAAGYGPIAQLEGIFRTKFSDEGSIPASDYGYVALAQGLGLVTGDSAVRFLSNSSATRAQAAVMLCQLMSC